MTNSEQDFSINIIGYGYVGSAIGHLCESNNLEFNVCDKISKFGKFTYYKDISTLVLSNSKVNSSRNYYFIAVPTPSDNVSGECDTSIVKGVLEELVKNRASKENSTIIIKSTVSPGTTRRFVEEFTDLDIVFCPEFLTEKHYLSDIYNADFVIIANTTASRRQDLDNLFKKLYAHKTEDEFKILYNTYEEGEIFKYSLNVYFAVKVWYFNEIYEICDKLGVKYDTVKSMYSLDSRIGTYGIDVPGYDGKFSFGGSCLPKETRGMINLQQHLSIPNDTLKALMQRSIELRKK